MQAVQAWPRLDLAPEPQLEPAHLSRLVADLIRECHLLLSSPLLAAPGLSHFVEHAAPRSLHLHGPHSASDLVHALASYTSLLDLTYSGGLVPAPAHLLPHSLRVLTVSLCGHSVTQELDCVLQSVQSLLQLQDLQLRLSCDSNTLPEPFPSLPCRVLTLSFTDETRPQNPAALWRLAAEAISIVIRVILTAASDFSLYRQQLWAALTRCPPLQQLCVSRRFSGPADPASQGELRQLALLRCRCVVMSDLLGSPLSPQLLRSLSCEHVVCHICVHNSRSLQWLELAVRAGVYVVELRNAAALTVVGAPAAVPAFDAPWAIVIRQPQQGVVQGVSLCMFRPGPQGHLVWGNRAVCDASLSAAYAALRL